MLADRATMPAARTAAASVAGKTQSERGTDTEAGPNDGRDDPRGSDDRHPPPIGGRIPRDRGFATTTHDEHRYQ